MGRLILGFTPILLLVAIATSAGAQDVDDIVAEIELRGYYVESGAGADINELERIAAQSRNAAAIVILAAEADGGDDLLADQVFQQSGAFDTVVVVSDAGIGARSVFDDSELAGSLESALATGRDGGSNEEIAEAFVDRLPGALDQPAEDTAVAADSAAATSGTSSEAGSGGGGISVFWVLVVLALIVGAIWFFVSRSRKRSGAAGADDIEVARREIRDQLDVIANEILENQDTIELSNNEQAIDHYREANATFAAAVETLDQTTNLAELAELNDRVDRARWQLDAAEALVEGRPVPAEPEPDKPVACFFDPTHKPGTEDAMVRTAAGEKAVAVCGSCADKLRRGERPQPREISVGGRRVPAAKAPKSHGGRGMGGLDIFDIVLGGLGGLGGILGGGKGDRRPQGGSSGTGVSHDWGNPLGTKRSRRDTGVFGPDRLPPGGRGLGRRSGGGGRGRIGKGRARGRF